ncbi:MAG: 23S rRNA (adenine(2030)-N(6))-methyltransferase RlmJ [Xanthobacteraceae bacterium]|nr:23S rRNA (adenine(2030)-N(6))-methyltransferase RlmJ [Xanthobacteraceae bacterium]
MNYRHAFHAGNFADVHKHSVLARILVYLRAKPAPFRVIDTHAGSGRYDLLAPEASRGGEWQAGIGRVWQAAREGATPPLLSPYLEAVAALNPDGRLRAYPGSPLIAQHLLRPQDRLIACELEPRAGAALANALRGDARAKAISIDGWTALGANVPPKERRGLVLIDPPFEDTADFALLSNALAAAYRKWPNGIYLLWYPIKEREAPDALAQRLKRLGIPDLLRSELTLGLPRAGAGLVGSGLIAVNPPFTLERDLRSFMPALARILSPEVVVRTDRLAGERRAGGAPADRR